jgi:hypothetical protein
MILFFLIVLLLKLLCVANFLPVSKPLVSPTNQYPVLKINHCDIVFISQLENSATCITIRAYIFGYATHTLAE